MSTSSKKSARKTNYYLFAFSNGGNCLMLHEDGTIEIYPQFFKMYPGPLKIEIIPS